MNRLENSTPILSQPILTKAQQTARAQQSISAETKTKKNRKNWKVSKRTILIFGMSGIAAVLIIFIIVSFALRADQTVVPKVVYNQPKPLIVKQPAAVYGPPLRLKIPVINVDAAVIYVGLTSGGAMDTPKTPVDVAWYKLGPHPGEVGSAVIDGHFGWINNIPAVFDNIHKLNTGDKIIVDDDKGVSSTFVVTSLRTFGKNDDANVVFNSKDGKAHLNLITCQGTWNKSEESYANRLVVFSDLTTAT